MQKAQMVTQDPQGAGECCVQNLLHTRSRHSKTDFGASDPTQAVSQPLRRKQGWKGVESQRAVQNRLLQALPKNRGQV